MELMPREPDGREQENTTPQRPGAPARSAVRPDAGEPRAIQEQVPGAEPLPPRSSAARIERIRRRKRMRRIRAAAVCAVLLAAVLAYFTGIYGASVTEAKPLAMVNGRKLLLLEQGEVSVFEPPAPPSASAG